MACRLDRLQADGPHGPIWWRYGRKHGGQTLTAALDNNGYYSRDAYMARGSCHECRREAVIRERPGTSALHSPG
ncbi:hypothetical protein ACGFX2_38355 [Streptomyces goshikiensis]|uniref:hypothetical protein n=1 Tax=Streptomyces goshikiensis TaxID=1942 RepID=UPI00372010D6